VRLTRVHIRNFRSIANTWITFEPTCRILVGINESGKSNILRALALLDDDRNPTPDDVREFAPDENPDQDAFVRFFFALEKEERAQCYEDSLEKILVDDPAATVLRHGSARYNLEKFFELKHEGTYEVDLRTRKRRALGWRLSEGFTVAPGWKKPSAACPPNFQVVKGDGASAPLVSFSLIHESAVREVPSEYLTSVEPEGVNNLALQEINPLVRGELPGCMFWSYSEENLLPARINLASFAATPASCIPLKVMFALADITNVTTAVQQAEARANGMRNLLDRVAKRSTQHLHSIWKDYRGVRIGLALNGPNIEASIKDHHNHFDLSRRSDGFKRFVTFLLMISAQVKVKTLLDTLYLQDEPDAGLHPSGARYLRDELIRIARNNFVVFSTHSPFMIDKELLGRHLIVEKKAEVTTVREVDESNVVDEEVIYNAIGYSIFENLKARNIIFEGWRDKRLFQVAMQAVPSKLGKLKSTLADVGLCHAQGVKDIGKVAMLLELGDREWIVISDADRVAVEQQREYDGKGPWYRYDQLLERGPVLTGEDFVKAETVRAVATRVAAGRQSEELPLAALQGDQPKLATVKGWLQRGGVSGQELKLLVDMIKEQLFSNLKPSQVEPKYYEFLSELAKKLK